MRIVYKTSTLANIYKTHKKFFARKNNVEWIPPTKAAMEVLDV
jgi:hypothetical protein